MNKFAAKKQTPKLGAEGPWVCWDSFGIRIQKDVFHKYFTGRVFSHLKCLMKTIEKGDF